MIVFLDTDNLKVLLYYDKGLREIPFSQINSLKKIVPSGNLIYITNAVETSVNDIVNLVSEVYDGEIEKEVEKKKEEKIYIHSISDGVILIPEGDFKLKGRYDIRKINEKIFNMMKNSDSLKSLLASGKVVRITKTERKNLLIEQKIKMEEAYLLECISIKWNPEVIHQQEK
jgi:hypothetical protein